MQARSSVSVVVTISSLVVATNSLGGEETPLPDAFRSICDDLWGAAVIYERDSNPCLQKLAFTGRMQFDYATIDGEGTLPGDAGESDISFHDLTTRRLRAGFMATVFENFTLRAEADFQPEADPFYRRITEASIGWSACEAFQLKVGKQAMGFTLDGKTSSRELLAIDRSNLTNNLWFNNEHIPGITFGGMLGNWRYQTGIFSQGEDDGEFGNFDGGTSWLASVGYDFSEMTGADEALLALDFVQNEETPASPALFTNRSLGQVVSLNFRVEKDAFGFRSDLAAGDGFLGQSDVWGLSVMPYYNVNEKLQAVFRFTFIESGEENGVRFARYESESMLGAKGDQYREAYLGFNYYLYGHKLKLQTGLQHVAMNDRADDGGEFDGYAWTTGLRVSW